MGKGSGTSPGNTTAQDLVGVQVNDLVNRVSALEQGQSDLTSVDVTIPEPCTPNYVLSYENIKGKLRANTCVLVPKAAETLTTIIVRDSDATSQAAFEAAFLIDGDVPIDDASAAAGHFETKFAPRLEVGTLYRLVRLICHGAGLGKSKNPPDDPLYTDVPLATFTTPGGINPPSAPASNLIKYNRLDSTTQAFDAEAGLRVFAPLTDAGAAQTWGASQCTDVMAVVQRGNNVVQHFPHALTGTDLTQTDGTSTPANRGYVDIPVKPLIPSETCVWVKNIAIAGDNGVKNSSSTANITFFAALLGEDPTTLTSLSLTITTATDPNNPKQAKVTLNFTQPGGTQVALKHVKVERKLSSDPSSAYDIFIEKSTLKFDDLTTAGAHSVVLADGAVFKPSKTYDLRTTITGIGFTQVQFTTSSVTTGSNPDVTADTAVPSSLGTPNFSFIPKAGLHLDNMTVGAQWNTGVSKSVVVYNGSSTYFDLPTYMSSGGVTVQAAASESAARYNIGPGKVKTTLEVRLRDLISVFGSVTIQSYFYAANQVGTSSKSTDSGTINLANAKDNVNASDAVNKIAAGVIPPGRQIFSNSDFLRLSGSDLLTWSVWNGSAPITSGSGNVTVINTATAHIKHNQTAHTLVFTTSSTRYLAYNLRTGRLLPGEYQTFVAQFRSNTTLANMEMRILYARQDNAANNLDNVNNPALAYASLPLTGLNTSFQEFAVPLKVKDSPSLDDGVNNVNQWFIMLLVGTLGGNQVEMARPVFVRGLDPPKHTIREDEEGLMDIIISGITGVVDITNAVGSAGGFENTSGTGLGGRLSREIF